MAFDAHTNFAYSTVAVAPSPAASGTSLDVAAGEGALFPAVPFNATVWPTGVNPLSTNAEIVRVTNITGDTLTITRAQESSAARTVIVGDQIAATITTKTLTDVEGYFLPKVSFTQNVPLNQAITNNVLTKGVAGIHGSNGFGSSLFLQRIMIPANMNITEAHMAMNLQFAVSEQAGSMSRSLIIYSFGNSTSLASVSSVSGLSIWTTGTSTVGGSASITQFHGGWSLTVIHEMTFPVISLTPGEYVIGQLFNVSQATSTGPWIWRIVGTAPFGMVGLLAGSSVTSANVLSSGGLLAGSFITSSASSSFTAWTAAPTNATVISNAGTVAKAFYQWTSASSTAYTTANAGSASNVSNAMTASQIAVFSVAPTAVSVFSNAGTAAFPGMLVGTGGLLAASALTSSASVAVLSSIAFGASTGFISSTQNFSFFGTASTLVAQSYDIFFAGIMSTGAVPTAITLTSTAVTYSGSAMAAQPWFALIGS